MQFVVGLGNPGEDYASSRHNVGFLIVESFARMRRAPRWRRQHRARITEVGFAGRRLTLALPLTYMNLSGQAVAPLSRERGVPPSDLLVIHDDKDLAEGTLRVKVGGGDAGHKGIRSLVEDLGDPGFARLRVGIGAPVEGRTTSEYVLEPLDGDSRDRFLETVEKGTKALAQVLAQGPERAMNEINRRSKPPEESQA